MLQKDSVAEPEQEPHHFGGAGSGTATPNGPSSVSSFKLDVHHRWIIKNVTNFDSFLFFLFNFTPI
jgi:hypothetical protein